MACVNGGSPRQGRHDVIEVCNLRLRTEVGISPHEIGKKQDVVIDLRLGCDLRKAGKSDDIRDTLNYRDVAKDIIGYVEATTFNTVEKMATDIARISIALHEVPWIEVRVHKPQALRFSDTVGVLIERTPEDFNDSVGYLSLGSNIEPRKNLRAAIALLKKKVLVIKSSSAFLTPPVLYHNQPDIVNMAVQIVTDMTPSEMKDVISGIEDELLRVCDPNNKNGPRTIDIDISLWRGAGCFEKDELEYDVRDSSGHSHQRSRMRKKLPHPDVSRFGHVIVPLAEISPKFKLPPCGTTLHSMAQKITGRTDYLNAFPLMD